MGSRPLHILSTKLLDDALIRQAGDQVQLDCISFLEIQPAPPDEVRVLLSDVPASGQYVIFTSANAVNAVAAALTEEPQWKVFCIEAATKKKVQQLFPRSGITAAAPNGAQLVKQIIAQAPDNVVFFCGNRRLDTIPEALKKNGIHCREKWVYRTTATASTIHRQYDGILFYSPSGVESFFSVNAIAAATTAISIGPSTTAALRNYTSTIVEAPQPDIRQMLQLIPGCRAY